MNPGPPLRAEHETQGQGDWWRKVQEDLEKMARLRAAYEARCPPKPWGKREPFIIAQYQEEVRQKSGCWPTACMR